MLMLIIFTSCRKETQKTEGTRSDESHEDEISLEVNVSGNTLSKLSDSSDSKPNSSFTDKKSINSKIEKPDKEMVFTDKAVAEYVKKRLEKDKIYASDMRKLKKIHIKNKTVTDLSFLKHCINAETLILENTNTKNLKNISSLAKLKTLTLCDVPIRSIEAIIPLKSLENITLSGTAVTDVSPIAKSVNKKQLKSINIIDSKLTDISPLADYDVLNGLNELYLSCNNIHDLSAFSKIKETPKIGTIDLSDNRILNFKPFEKIYNASEGFHHEGVKSFFLKNAFQVYYNQDMKNKKKKAMPFDTVSVPFYRGYINKKNSNQGYESYSVDEDAVDDGIWYVNAKNFIENLGGEYSYDKNRSELIMTLNDIKIVMRENWNYILVNDRKKTLKYHRYGKEYSVLKIMGLNVPYIPVIETAEELGLKCKLKKVDEYDDFSNSDVYISDK